MGFREILINTLLLGLFTFSFIYFLFITGTNNDSLNILNDPSINKTFQTLNKTLPTYQVMSETQLNATTSETPLITFGELVLFSVLRSVKVFLSIITGTYTIFMNLATETLGVPAIVFNVIIAIILITVIFFSWRLYRQGY